MYEPKTAEWRQQNRARFREGQTVRSKSVIGCPSFVGTVEEMEYGSAGIYYNVRDEHGNLWCRQSNELSNDTAPETISSVYDEIAALRAIEAELQGSLDRVHEIIHGKKLDIDSAQSQEPLSHDADHHGGRAQEPLSALRV